MAESMPREEYERLLFFESAREQAEAEWSENNRDTQALTRWGGALLELAHFRQGPEAVEYIDLAVSKFEAALALDSRKHDALWCLGNALTSQGFLFADGDTAQEYFTRARDCFTRALAEEPGNEIYRKALEMTARAPQLHAELQKQFAQQQAAEFGGAHQGGRSRGGAGGATQGGLAEADARLDWVYDLAGYGILAAIAVGWVLMAQRAGN